MMGQSLTRSIEFWVWQIQTHVDSMLAQKNPDFCKLFFFFSIPISLFRSLLIVHVCCKLSFLFIFFLHVPFSNALIRMLSNEQRSYEEDPHAIAFPSCSAFYTPLTWHLTPRTPIDSFAVPLKCIHSPSLVNIYPLAKIHLIPPKRPTHIYAAHPSIRVLMSRFFPPPLCCCAFKTRGSKDPE